MQQFEQPIETDHTQPGGQPGDNALPLQFADRAPHSWLVAQTVSAGHAPDVRTWDSAVSTLEHPGHLNGAHQGEKATFGPVDFANAVISLDDGERQQASDAASRNNAVEDEAAPPLDTDGIDLEPPPVPPTVIAGGECEDDHSGILPGEALRYTNGEWELLPALTPAEAATSPERDTVYAEADTIAIGKDGPTLNGSSEGCRVVTLYNDELKVGGLVHVDVLGMGDQTGEELIDELLEAAPELRAAIAAEVFGDEDTSPLGEPLPDRPGQPAAEWNERLAAHLRARGVESVTIIAGGRGKDVSLDTKTGVVEAFDAAGNRLYPVELVEETPDSEPAEPTEPSDQDIVPDAETADVESGHEFSMQQATNDLDLSGRRLAQAHGDARILESFYYDALRHLDAPVDTAGKAELLDGLLGEQGSQGLEILLAMVRERHVVLKDLRPGGDDSLIRSMLAQRIDARIGELDDRINRMPAATDEQLVARNTLQKRRSGFAEALDRLRE